MLHIRLTQVQDLERSNRDQFVDFMMLHLLQFFSHQCEKMETESVRRTILVGIEKARTYGIESERDVCKFIDLMFAFGNDYDVRLSWVRKTLNERDPRQSIGRMDRLMTQAQSFLSHSSNGDFGK